MLNVVWTINDSFWDMGLPKWILERADKCQHYQGLHWAKELQGTDVGVIVIPGQHCTHRYIELNEAAANFKRVVFVIVGDEEAKFRSEKLEHPEMRIWWFAPPWKTPQRADHLGPFGWPTGALELITAAKKEASKERIYNLNFCGQVTHERRAQCVRAAISIPTRQLIFPTHGFAQGMAREDYYEHLLESRFVLCPSGPCMPDSFRFAEALECGCVPIVDNKAPDPEYPRGYWKYLFTSFPFPFVDEWDELPKMFPHLIHEYEDLQRLCTSWWQTEKELMVLRMQGNICRS
jgi:hypothetical protein